MRWSDPAPIAALAAAACLVSALLSRWAIAYSHRKGLLDQPGERRSHEIPTPRGGGIGIVVACLAAILVVAAGAQEPLAWALVATGLLLVAGIGWWDDHRALGAGPRLLVHAVAATLLAGALHLQGAGAGTSFVGLVLALGLVNAWNFMDGIDGLAASQALLCGVGLGCILSGAWAVLGFVLAAACLGFLPFNARRARVFLGDVGSGALGYLVAALLAAAMASQPVIRWPVLLLAPMVMLVDAGLTLAWRMHHRQRWWEAHALHLFQQASRRHGHASVALVYALWTLGAIGLMLVLQRQSPSQALVISLAVLAASVMVWVRLHGTGALATEGFGT